MVDRNSRLSVSRLADLLTSKPAVATSRLTCTQLHGRLGVAHVHLGVGVRLQVTSLYVNSGDLEKSKKKKKWKTIIFRGRKNRRT